MVGVAKACPESNSSEEAFEVLFQRGCIEVRGIGAELQTFVNSLKVSLGNLLGLRLWILPSGSSLTLIDSLSNILRRLKTLREHV